MTGVFRAAALKQQGHSGADIDRLMREERLFRIRRGWYATPSASRPVVEAVARGGVLSCVSALRHYEIWVPPDKRLHVRFPLRKAHDRGSCRGFGAMPPINNAVDPLLVAYCCAARCLDDEGFVAVTDSILNSTDFERADLIGALAAAPQRIGRLMDWCDGRAQSGTESIARVRFRKAGIKVEVQVYVEGVGVVDMLIGERLIVECDSKQFHTGVENYQRDRDRDRRSTLDKYITLRLTYMDVMYRWNEVFADIRALIKRREHRRKPVKP